EPYPSDYWDLNGDGPSKEHDRLDLYRLVPQDLRASVPDHVPELHEHYKPPPPLPPQSAPHRGTPQPAPAKAPGAAPSACGDAGSAAQPAANSAGPGELPAQLAEAFLRGAGVKDVKFPAGMTPEIMEVIGRILRESVQGTLDLLIARAQVK